MPTARTAATQVLQGNHILLSLSSSSLEERGRWESDGTREMKISRYLIFEVQYVHYVQKYKHNFSVSLRSALQKSAPRQHPNSQRATAQHWEAVLGFQHQARLHL